MASIDISCKTNHESVSNDGDNLTLLTHISTKEMPINRKPIDLVVVLDTSGSMDGEKLELCKKTLNFLCQKQLTKDDRFGLVLFNSYVDVCFKLSYMTSDAKITIANIINTISAYCNTNLSGGLMSGLEQFKEIDKEQDNTSSVKALLLLTDGQLNEGISDHTQLINCFKNEYNEFKDKPCLFSLGYGSDCDVDILKKICDVGNGMFYSILSTEAVPLAFADIIGGLTTIAAQNIVVTITSPFKIIDNPLTSYPFEILDNGNKVQVTVKDLYAGEKRDILFKIPVNKGNDEVKLHISTKYLDCFLERNNIIPIMLTIPRCEGVYSGPSNMDINKQIIRFNAYECIKKIENEAKNGDIQNAKRMAEEDLVKFDSTVKSFNIEDDPLIKEIRSYIVINIKGLQNQYTYINMGQHRIVSSCIILGSQRNNQVDFTDVDDEGNINVIAMPMVTSGFITPSKQNMVYQFSQGICFEETKETKDIEECLSTPPPSLATPMTTPSVTSLGFMLIRQNNISGPNQKKQRL